MKPVAHNAACPTILFSGLGGAGPLRDPAVRYGLKFGIAGVLAVCVSLFLRLENPGWALFTVFMLMIAQYVGAVAEKSFFRLVGTIVGGALGYVITGAFEQNPVIFLGLIGLVVGTCTALFGQSRYPYAFLLCGLTTTVVAGNGMDDPQNSWTFMLSRVEEIFVGIVVTLVVQSVLWPRYARVEFLENLRSSFGDLRECFLQAPGISAAARETPGDLRARDFPARISGLRTLLEFGTRESLYFRRKLHVYFELTVCLAKIAYAIGTLRERVAEDSPYRTHAGDEAEAVHSAIAAALADLEDARPTTATRAQAGEAMDSAFKKLDGAFLDMRARNLVRAIPSDEAMILGLHVLALDEIRAQIARSHELLEALAPKPLEKEKSPAPAAPPWPPPFWIRTGLKSALAIMTAFLLDNWLHPPGGAMFVLGTWVFTALNAASPRGQGDRRAFHLIPLNVVILASLSLIILAASPMLSSYAVMNTLIFCWLFIWGYVSFTKRSMTIPMQLGMLVLVGILGLNGQEPVTFQAVMRFFFGIVLALTLAAVFQRLFWPSLPQWEIRDRFVGMLAICRRLLAREPLPLWIKTRLALIPGETQIRLAHMNPPICPQGEREKLAQLMNTLVRLGGNFAASLDKIQIPGPQSAAGLALIAKLEALFATGLKSLQSGFRDTSPVVLDEPAIRRAVHDLREWVATMRLEMIAADCPPLTNARLAGFGERYTLMADDILDAARQFSKLRLPLYMGDYAL